MFSTASPLSDLSEQLLDYRRRHEHLMAHEQYQQLSALLHQSKESLNATRRSQEELLQQLDKVDHALMQLNQLLRKNSEEKLNLESDSTTKKDQIDHRAQLMMLNAEALECRAVAIQLQQQAKLILSKANDMERALPQPATGSKSLPSAGDDHTKRSDSKEINGFAGEQVHSRMAKEKQIPTPIVSPKVAPNEHEYNHWPTREFMQDDHGPQCILRTSPSFRHHPIDVTYVPVIETEHLLEAQEELIGIPLKIQFDAKMNDQPFIIVAIPYINKRSTHHEHVIKLRQSTGLWMPIKTMESCFDDHRDKRFVQCQLTEPASCAVVSRLKRDHFLMEKNTSGQFISTADHRFTIQWPEQVAQKNYPMDARLHPVDLHVFTQFCQDFSYECQGLLAVGPIIELRYEDLPLLKPIRITSPILVPPKPKKTSATKSNATDPSAPTNPTPESIFQSMLAQTDDHERLLLLYSGFNENNTWYIDQELRLFDSKTRDLITTEIQSLHMRMIVVRYDRNLMSLKQLPGTISLLDQTLQTRPVTFLVRSRLNNPNELCFTCFASERRETIEHDLQKENYSIESEQRKEMFLHEGQMLDIRFRGNLQPIGVQQRRFPMAFNTHFPFYFETKIEVIDRYAQHLSSDYYGFLQIFSKQVEKKRALTDIVGLSATSTDQDLCLIELLIRLPKASKETCLTPQKVLTNFVGEGILTPNLFRDLSASLSGDEWRRLARRLGMSRIRIEAIEHDYREDAPYYMLLTWFKRVSKASDKVAILINALKLINRRDLAKDLQSIKEDKRYEQHTVSKEEQLRVLSVAFNRIIQREECVRIWKQIARELCLTNENINQIEHDFSSRQERCLRCLEHWAFNEIRADVFCLAKVIRSLGFKTLARELEDMT